MKNRSVLSVFWETTRTWKWFTGAMVLAVTIMSLIDIAIPPFYKRFFDALLTRETTKQNLQPILVILVTILALHGASWLLNTLSDFAFNRLMARGMADLQNRAFSYLIGHSYQFFSNQFSGSLVRRINKIAQSYQSIFEIFLDIFWPLTISVVGILFVLFGRNRWIGLIILAWTLAILAFNYFYARWKYTFDIERSRKDSEVTGVLSDAIANQNNIQLFTGNTHENKRVKEITDELVKLRIFGWSLGVTSNAVQQACMILVEFVATYVAVKLWQKNVLTIGDFALLQGYILMLFGKLRSFRKSIRSLYEAFADAQEMVDIMNTPHEIQNIRGAKPLVVKKAAIEFKEVGFSYHQTRTVLKHFDLKIKPKEKVAFVGSSGAGKSTIVKLLFRFYDIDRGKILIDDQNISKVTQDSLHNQIALVPQEPILFHRTLMENIRYGRRDATDDEVIEAAKKAHCHEFISSLPLGYETFVGERGIKLSGGERQRVAIARAILKNAPILVLDEATSSLDSESEALIQDALHELMKDKTAIAIAHRLSTIMEMDRIIVMDEGRVVDTGTHESLLKKKDNIYKTLWEIQAGGFLP
ncbi:ABC transporter ATP-binding protein [Candidatus Uhrbacteria bacterium]|nr:ABC transporter ATP-binding protein [Candidatus Uhrbacteria bacterium]